MTAHARWNRAAERKDVGACRRLRAAARQAAFLIVLSPLIDGLIAAFQVVAGACGPKSAQRMALDILQRNREGGSRLAEALAASVEQVSWCRDCRTLTEAGQCRLCADADRDDSVLCVVESPADILAIEQAGGFRGRYFVLNGRLSPIDGVGAGRPRPRQASCPGPGRWVCAR